MLIVKMSIDQIPDDIDGISIAFASDMSPVARAESSRCDDPTSGIDRMQGTTHQDSQHCSVVPDAEFARELSADPASAAQTLWTLARREVNPRDIYVKNALASKMASILQVVQEQPVMRRPELLQYPFVDAVMEVILDGDSYSDLYGGQARVDAASTSLVQVDHASVVRLSLDIVHLCCD